MPFDLKKIKSLFIVKEELPGKSRESAPAESPSAKGPSASPGGAGTKLPEILEPGKVSDKLMEVLLSAMEEKNLPGLDYLEYKQSLSSLAKMPMDEPVRYQSAFAMAQAMGATPQKLIESANHYLDVLKGEEAKFGQALRNQQTDQIGSREENARKLEAAIGEKSEQIKKLTQEIDQHRSQMEKLKQEMEEAVAKVEGAKQSFTVTYSSLRSQILQDVENMKKYLK